MNVKNIITWKVYEWPLFFLIDEYNCWNVADKNEEIFAIYPDCSNIKKLKELFVNNYMYFKN